MKAIELRRHSVKDGHGDRPLSPEGVALARRVGERDLRGRDFSHVFVSSLLRTRQTFEAFVEGAGDIRPQDPTVWPPHREASDTEEGMSLWSGVCQEAERAGGDMLVAASERDPERARRVARAGADAFRHWIAEIPEDARVLVIGHSPFLELVAWALSGRMPHRLMPCDGMRLHCDREGSCRLETSEDDPSLRAVRE